MLLLSFSRLRCLFASWLIIYRVCGYITAFFDLFSPSITVCTVAVTSLFVWCTNGYSMCRCVKIVITLVKYRLKFYQFYQCSGVVLSIRHENKSKNAPETEIKEPRYPQFSKFNCVKIVTFSCKMHKISVTWSYNGIFSDVSNKSTWKSDLLNENRKVSSEHVAGVCQKCHFSRKRFLCVKSVIFLWNWNKKFVYLSTQWRF